MYGAYERTVSVFQNSDMMAKGPAGAGRARAAGAVPRPGAGRGVRRALCAAGLRRFRTGPALLRKARSCSHDAGCASRTASACCRTATPSPSNSCSTSRRSNRIICRLSGISRRWASTPRSAWSIRCNTALGATVSISTSPSSASAFLNAGDSLRSFFSSQAAATKGSQNLAGIADPAIDALIDAIVAAETAPRFDGLPGA